MGGEDSRWCLNIQGRGALCNPVVGLLRGLRSADGDKGPLLFTSSPVRGGIYIDPNWAFGGENCGEEGLVGNDAWRTNRVPLALVGAEAAAKTGGGDGI